MTLLSRATDAAERMDEPDVDLRTLAGALGHIRAVNRWLGARRALLRHLDWALPGTDPVRALDIGTGSGDLAEALVRWGWKRGRSVSVVGLDLHAGTLAVARTRLSHRLARQEGGVRLVLGDGLRLPFPDDTFHLVHGAMVLHHMEGPHLANLLREASRVARGRVLVGELERSLPNYLGARLLALTLWRANPLTRHDGPLSVLRAFTPGELEALAREAALGSPSVHRHPFYRIILRGTS